MHAQCYSELKFSPIQNHLFVVDKYAHFCLNLKVKHFLDFYSAECMQLLELFQARFLNQLKCDRQ
jgi:hypothetical protein